MTQPDRGSVLWTYFLELVNVGPETAEGRRERDRTADQNILLILQWPNQMGGGSPFFRLARSGECGVDTAEERRTKGKTSDKQILFDSRD